MFAEPAGRNADEVIRHVEVQALNYLNFISAVSGELRTDSLKVAAVHGKRHAGVLRLIRLRAQQAGAWGVRDSAETQCTDPQNGQSYPMFTMTQSGYQFLVAKMTGAKSVKHQIAFIDAFDAMAAYIKKLINLLGVTIC